MNKDKFEDQAVKSEGELQKKIEAPPPPGAPRKKKNAPAFRRGPKKKTLPDASRRSCFRADVYFNLRRYISGYGNNAF